MAVLADILVGVAASALTVEVAILEAEVGTVETDTASAQRVAEADKTAAMDEALVQRARQAEVLVQRVGLVRMAVD